MQGLIVDKNSNSIIVSTSKGLTVCGIFARSVWGESGWKDAVLRIPGSERLDEKLEFGTLSKTNAIRIPLKYEG